MRFCKVFTAFSLLIFVGLLFGRPAWGEEKHEHEHGKVEFSIRSVRSGKWTNAETWMPARVPANR